MDPFHQKYTKQAGCMIGFLKALFVLRLFALNDCGHLCVTLSRRCAIVIQTTQTLDRYNEKTVESSRRLSLLSGARESKACVSSMQMATALGGQRSVKQVI